MSSAPGRTKTGTRDFADPPPEVEAVFDGYPPDLRRRLLELRRVVLGTAAATPGVGRIEEALKWGEPSFLTPETKSGSTVRIGPRRKDPRQYAVYFNCQTTLVESFRTWFPTGLNFDGNRAIVFDLDEPLPEEAVAECVAAALTYHTRSRAVTHRARARRGGP